MSPDLDNTIWRMTSSREAHMRSWPYPGNGRDDTDGYGTEVRRGPISMAAEATPLWPGMAVRSARQSPFSLTHIPSVPSRPCLIHSGCRAVTSASRTDRVPRARPSSFCCTASGRPGIRVTDQTDGGTRPCRRTTSPATNFSIRNHHKYTNTIKREQSCQE